MRGVTLDNRANVSIIVICTNGFQKLCKTKYQTENYRDFVTLLNSFSQFVLYELTWNAIDQYVPYTCVI